ncbi:MAG TPA: ATP-binding protein [Melioribacteraceae bacterium]|nr:ATP-binding protein [Melioribacteraceae bacterium]
MENQLSIVLSRNKLLKNVDINRIDYSGIKGKLMTISEGQILYREGDNADTIYLIISGEINLLKKRMLGKPKSYIFSQDEFVGNDEYFEETSRFSTAVALRDSYIIALSKNEIENLIEQDDQVYENLRLPAVEIDTEIENLKPTSSVDDLKIGSSTKEDFQLSEESKPATGDEDFFKSIADTTRPDTSNLIQPIEESSVPDQTTPEPVDEKSPDFELNAFLNEDGIPKSEVDLTETEESSTPAETGSVLQKEEDFLFNEYTMLNEDGIPKPEFELPETENIKPPPEPVFNDLDEALFSLLSGEATLPEPDVTGNLHDANPAEEFFDVNRIPAEKPLEKIVEPEEIKEIIPEPEPISESSEPVETFPSFNDFESEEIFEEADKNLAQLIQPDEPEKILPSFNKEDAMNNDQLQMIIKAAELVNSTIKIDEVLKNIVEVASNLTNADRGTLYLVDREKGELWSLIAMGSERKEIRVKLGEGLSGFVAKTGEILNIKDARSDPRWRSDFDKTSGYVTKTALTFPIHNNKDEIIGVLQLLNSRNGEFSKLDEELLNAMSIHSALALQNAEMVEKLLQVERVQSLGKMANFLIQDIKKPILVSKRYVEHLKSKSLSPDNAQIVDMLHEQLSQVADLVQTTSSYSEGKTILRTLTVSINNTLADYASRIGAYVESRNCQIVAEYDKDITVKLDVKEFYQCYMHLVKNACDAMPDGGNIYVSTKRDDKEKKIKIFVRDNGLGIADSLKSKIFEPFFTQGKKEGAGLGLSITKKVVESHNGKIDVQSSLGEGATFIITLPTASSI